MGKGSIFCWFFSRDRTIISFDLGAGQSTACAIISLMDKALILLSLLSFLLIITMMFSFSPSDVGVIGVFAFFILCYVLFLGLAVFGCRLFFILRAKLDKKKSGIFKKKSYYYGSVIALAPILILVGRSFGNISILEIGLVLVVEAMLCFLVSRNIL